MRRRKGLWGWGSGLFFLVALSTVLAQPLEPRAARNGGPLFEQQLAPDKDNTLFENLAGDVSNGAGPYLYAGATNVGQLRRGLISFPIAANFPAGAIIIEARLTMSMSMSIAGSTFVTLHPATVDWGEGTSDAGDPGGGGAAAELGDATWLHRFYPVTFWAMPGGDFAPTTSGVVQIGGVGAYTWGSTAAMVADVQGWLDAPETNAGWTIRSDEAVVPSTKRFNSREFGVVEERPFLTIMYQLPHSQFLPIIRRFD